MLSRRGLLRGLIAAPAIVAAAHIMPVRAVAGLAHLEGEIVTVIAPDYVALLAYDIEHALQDAIRRQYIERTGVLVPGEVGLWRGLTFIETLPRDQEGKQ